MADVELLSYEIRKLKMVNNIPASGRIQLENAMNFSVEFELGSKSAVAVLTEDIRHREQPDIFCMRLELQGTFWLDGIMNYASKKEAYVRCYDELFPYAKQIVSYLAANSGMQGLVLGKSDMVFDDINNTKPVDRTTSGKIIELRTGFRG